MDMNAFYKLSFPKWLTRRREESETPICYKYVNTY